MMRLLSFAFVLICAFSVSPFRLARAEELANRRGVESHWKRSGRITRVVDYPFSPAMGTYGRFWRREWGNRGFLFSLPTEEVVLGDVLPPEDESVPATEDLTRREKPAVQPSREESSQEGLQDEIARLKTELDEERARAEDEAIKRRRIELQLEEMEKSSLPSDRILSEGVPADLVPSRTDLYLVRPNDNLWTIAGQPEVYNDPFKWLLLYHANRGQIFHPDWIYPDMVLLVPRYPGLQHSASVELKGEPGLGQED